MSLLNVNVAQGGGIGSTSDYSTPAAMVLGAEAPKQDELNKEAWIQLVYGATGAVTSLLVSRAILSSATLGIPLLGLALAGGTLSGFALESLMITGGNKLLGRETTAQDYLHALTTSLTTSLGVGIGSVVAAGLGRLVTARLVGQVAARYAGAIATNELIGVTNTAIMEKRLATKNEILLWGAFGIVTGAIRPIMDKGKFLEVGGGMVQETAEEICETILLCDRDGDGLADRKIYQHELIGSLQGALTEMGGHVRTVRTSHVRQEAHASLISTIFRGRENNKIAEVVSPTSLSYARHWEAERMFLDGIQNHLPGDSGGTWVKVELLVGSQWQTLADCQGVDPSRVEGVRYSDDGQGFHYDLLGELFSTKTDDAKSVGEHGEGLKMIGAAALRHGFGFEVKSRDWVAIPRVVKKTVDENVIEKPVYDVYRSPIQKGSSTTILRNGADGEFDKLVNLVLDGGKQVLALRAGYCPLFRAEAGEIMDDSRDIFIKGIHVTSKARENLLFGYNLTGISSNRDRDSVARDDLDRGIYHVLKELDDPVVIQSFIQKAQGRKDDSMDMYGLLRWSTSHAKVWKNVFTQKYGNKAVLSSDGSQESPESVSLAQALGFTVIHFPPHMRRFLFSCSIKTAKEIVASEDVRLLGDETYNPEKIQLTRRETSVTLTYRSAKWNLWAAVRDLLANHMPRDCGGTDLPVIELQVETGDYYNPIKWVPLGTFIGGRKVLALRISDDGVGYDESVLGRLFSDKGGEDSTGQFGEGMDMSAATILRIAKDNGLNMQVRFRSRNWVAMPFATGITIGGKLAGLLNYKIATGLAQRKGSSTTLFSPPAELLAQLDKLGTLVLPFNPNFKALHRGPEGELFDGVTYAPSIPSGTVFVHDFRVTDAFKGQLLFSYNLNTRDVSPDRDQVNPSVVKPLVEGLIKNCENPTVVHRLLEAAYARSGTDYCEFAPLTFGGDKKTQAALYKKTFYEIYGANAVLASPWNAFVQAEAIHRAYKPIVLHPNVRKTLVNAGVLTDFDVARENFDVDVVPYERLTPAERGVLNRFADINAVLGLRDIGCPIIYENLRLRDGRSRDDIPGFYNQGGTEPPYIRRDQLASLANFTETYTHERGHEVSRKGDPEDEFREFFERGLAVFVLGRLEREGDLTEGAAQLCAALGLVHAMTRRLEEGQACLRQIEASNAEATARILRVTNERDKMAATLEETRQSLAEAQPLAHKMRARLLKAHLLLDKTTPKACSYRLNLIPKRPSPQPWYMRLVFWH